MTRRLALRRLLLGLWSAATAVACGFTGGSRTSGERSARDGTGSSTELTPLSAVELATLLAFGEVIVEGRALSPAERDELAERVEESARRNPDQLSSYRTAAATLDRLAGARFARLELSGRAKLVARHRLDVRIVQPDEDPGALGTEVRTVRTKTVPDLIDAYWSSPTGWAAVGYATFPGRCGDLSRYTRPEA
jgi:hypothetical protein